jgi:hypothetical protein
MMVERDNEKFTRVTLKRDGCSITICLSVCDVPSALIVTPLA